MHPIRGIFVILMILGVSKVSDADNVSPGVNVSVGFGPVDQSGRVVIKEGGAQIGYHLLVLRDTVDTGVLFEAQLVTDDLEFMSSYVYYIDYSDFGQNSLQYTTRTRTDYITPNHIDNGSSLLCLYIRDLSSGTSSWRLEECRGTVLGKVIHYPNPTVFGYPVGAYGILGPGIPLWQYSSDYLTARRFCRDQGLVDYTDIDTSIRSSGYAYVRGEGGEGPWSVTGNSDVTILDRISCLEAADEVNEQLYSTPTVYGAHVGRLNTSSVSREETAKQFCIRQGHAPAYRSFSVGYPPGGTYSYWNGSSWGITGASSGVEWLTNLTCVDVQ